MEQDPIVAVRGIDPAELEQVPEHLEDPEPEAAAPAAKPGGPLRFARMTGSSIAARDGAGWVTDFLNAAYYRWPVAEREVDDMRLAFAILTTYWYRRESPRRLRLTDLRAFHHAFSAHRFDTDMSGRGLLSRDQLLDAGTWDPMPWHVEQSYRRAGRAAQHAFWGQGGVGRLSMLHQLALQIR